METSVSGSVLAGTAGIVVIATIAGAANSLHAKSRFVDDWHLLRWRVRRIHACAGGSAGTVCLTNSLPLMARHSCARA